MCIVLLALFIMQWKTANTIFGRQQKGGVGDATVTTVSNVCGQKTQGIALLVADKQNPTVGCEVTLLLDDKTLHVLKGNTGLKKFDLDNIKTPIIIKTEECILLHSVHEENILCFFNKFSRDEWWMAITRQILCINQGKARNEIYGEATLEEIKMDLQSLEKKDEKKGINIHIDSGEAYEFPQVKVHYKE